MAKFRDCLPGTCGGKQPVFVGFNAGFDWSFVNWYFLRFLGENPFGFAPLDIKSYYMGSANRGGRHGTKRIGRVVRIDMQGQCPVRHIERPIPNPAA